jgi:hypothetical protein
LIAQGSSAGPMETQVMDSVFDEEDNEASGLSA